MKRPGNPAYSSKPAEDEFIFHREVAEAKPMLGDPRVRLEFVAIGYVELWQPYKC